MQGEVPFKPYSDQVTLKPSTGTSTSGHLHSIQSLIDSMANAKPTYAGPNPNLVPNPMER